MKLLSVDRRVVLMSMFICWSGFLRAQHSNVFAGNALYATVERYVALGEHRTGTSTDFATSEWLGNELKNSGHQISFYEFPLKQFFLEGASVLTHDKKNIEAFPLWYVSDSIALNVTGALTNGESGSSDVKGKIVLMNFSFGAEGQGSGKLIKQLNSLIDAGAKGIIGYQENAAGEIAAINAPQGGKAWKVPIVLVSPSDGKELSKQLSKDVSLKIAGSFRNVNARNVLGTVGTGDEYIVVSTPISGWFVCGGERGPGVAIWLALAKWAAAEKLPYKFVFTGNSGHELGFWGGKKFLEDGAPPVDKTKLWIHLGAGVATVAWKETPSGLVREERVDAKRNFFYSTSVSSPFLKAFAKIPGNKFDTNVKSGGELIEVIHKGYKNVAGAAYSHPYFHMKRDDATKTSPQVLEEAAVAFKNFIVGVVNGQR